MKSEGLQDESILRNPFTTWYHNAYGPLTVSRPKRSDYDEALIDVTIKCWNEVGMRSLYDLNQPAALGVAQPHFTHSENPGIRSSTAQSFLVPIRDRPNLKVLKKALVTKVLIEGMSAKGVEISLKSGRKINVYAKKEVVLSAGAINTPQLLLLSGIGPKTELEKFDIKSNAYLPVGLNLMDHVFVPIIFTFDGDLLGVPRNLSAPPNLEVFPTPSFSALFKVDNSSIFKTQPHIQLLPIYFNKNSSSTVAYFCSYIFEYIDEACNSWVDANQDKDLLFISVVLLHPKSRGKIELQSGNANNPPKIHLSYFSKYEDLEKIIKGIQTTLKLKETSFFKYSKAEILNFNLPNCKAFAFMSEDYWRCFSLETATTVWHPAGTAAIGPQGVVNSALKVRNVKNLRVVDASIMPSLVSGNINPAVIMIAERAADLIKKDHLSFSSIP